MILLGCSDIGRGFNGCSSSSMSSKPPLICRAQPLYPLTVSPLRLAGTFISIPTGYSQLFTGVLWQIPEASWTVAMYVYQTFWAGSSSLSFACSVFLPSIYSELIQPGRLCDVSLVFHPICVLLMPYGPLQYWRFHVNLRKSPGEEKGGSLVRLIHQGSSASADFALKFFYLIRPCDDTRLPMSGAGGACQRLVY